MQSCQTGSDVFWSMNGVNGGRWALDIGIHQREDWAEADMVDLVFITSIRLEANKSYCSTRRALVFTREANRTTLYHLTCLRDPPLPA